MNYFHVFMLTHLSLDKNGDVKSRNVAVTFDLFEAEDHRNKGVEYDYDKFVVPSDWQEDAATTGLVVAMREFRSMVEEMQEAALRTRMMRISKSKFMAGVQGGAFFSFNPERSEGKNGPPGDKEERPEGEGEGPRCGQGKC